jgi:hypothetical protein
MAGTKPAMRSMFLLIFLLAETALAGQTNDVRWWYAPKTNAIPLEAVDLSLVYDPMKDFRRRPAGHLYGDLVFRFKNVGKQVIDAFAACNLFGFGSVFLTPPEGTNLVERIPALFMGSFRGTPLSKPRDISPGDQMEFILKQPVYWWFPSMTNSVDGIYKAWWQIDQKKSNPLLFRKHKGNIEWVDNRASQPSGAPLPRAPQAGRSEGGH